MLAVARSLIRLGKRPLCQVRPSPRPLRLARPAPRATTPGCGSRLKLKRLVSGRHLHARVAKLCRELLHGCLLAMGKKRAGGRRRTKPGKKLGLISMGRKAVDGVNAGADRDVLAQHSHRAVTIDNLSSKGSAGSESNKNDRTLPAPQIVLEMMASPSAGRSIRCSVSIRMYRKSFPTSRS